MNPIKKVVQYATDAIPDWALRETRIKRAFSNESTGAGTTTDVLESMHVTLHRRFGRAYLEALYANFWAAAKVVDIKPDDAFSPGVVWAEDDDKTKRIQEEFKRLKFVGSVKQAIKAARLFGTAVLILAPKDGRFDMPFDKDNVRQGDISHLLVADRYQLEELVLYSNPAHPKFGEAMKYRWNYSQVQGQTQEGQERPIYPYKDIHASRCIRFDGIAAPTDDGWLNAGEERWGISVLQRAIDDILQDSAISASLVDIIKRACVPVIKKHGWTEVMARGGRKFEGEVSPEEAVRDISANISNAKLMIIDKEDEIGKLEVETAGVNDISKQITDRLAMIEGVPITRFTGESATGLSATGDGDARDWRITVEGYRKDNIDPQWDTLINIVAANIGLSEVPEWEWGMLGEATMEEKAETTKKMADTAAIMVKNGIWDEEEAREFMNNSEIVEFDPEDVPEVDETEMQPMSFGASGKNVQRQRMP